MALTLNGIPLGGLRAKRSGFGLGSFMFLCMFGVIFIAASFLFIQDDFKSIGWTPIEGKITNVSQSTNSDGDTTYRPTVSYVVDGQTFTTQPVYSSSQHYTIGKSQTVHYNPSNPGEGVIRTNGTGFFIYLFPVIGFAAIITATIALIRNQRRTAQIHKLKQRGIKIQGIVTNVAGSGSSNRSNNTSRITVSATTPDGQVRHYESDGINSIGVIGLAEYQTKPVAIDVYIDPIDPKIYYVDLDDIPDITPERIADLLQSALTQTKQPQDTPPPITPKQ